MRAPRFTVRRTNGSEVEVVRDLSRSRAVSLVERDTAAGTVSTFEQQSDVRASGRQPR